MGQVDEPVGVEGVARPDALEVEVEPVLGRGLGHRGEHLLGAGDARSVLLGEPLRVGPGLVAHGRSAGIELEGVPRDRDPGALGEPGERGLDAALADVTPGARDVGPYVHVEVLHGRAM